MRHLLGPLAVAALLSIAGPGSAETRADVYNGATCVPYPPFNSSNAVPYSHWLYGFRQMAFCHFTIPDDWTAEDISYVLFHGVANPGPAPLRVRLCVYDAFGLATSCGAERTLPDSGVFSTNWVAPGGMPSSPMGAFLSVWFPTDTVSAFAYFIPVFSR